MGLELIVMTSLVLLWMAQTTSARVNVSLAKEGCQAECGGIRIPYPFGIGANCYINDMYSVECRRDKLYLTGINLEVLNMSVEGWVQVNNPILSRSCPGVNGSADIVHGSRSVDLTGSPFVFSYRNVFISVGCNNHARVTNLADGTTAQCITICDGSPDQDNSCFGINCCQTTPPGNNSYYFRVFNVSLSRTGTNNQSGGVPKPLIPCMYAFLVDKDWLRYNLTGPFTLQGMDHVPAMLAWNLFNMEPSQLGIHKYRGGYCGKSRWFASASAPYSDIYSVACECEWGYEGNPYLPNGCVDVCLRNQMDPNCYLRKDNNSTTILIGVLAGSVGALLLLIAAWRLYKLIKKRNDVKRRQNIFKQMLRQQLSSADGRVEKTKLFDSKELEKATDHYNENRILGQGGQGTVYKGMLSDGRIIAVKKCTIVDEGKVDQFINEVVILSQINHRNVVKLLGCCLETEVHLLVYEFISNGTLFEHIHDASEDFTLSWEMRFRIAIEIAGALSYLHCAASIPIYHRDIKSTNILLDDKYKAKVADFGTSRSINIDQTHLTTLVKGTFGYLDPEYFQSSQFTDKSDVYSFGVVIVELLTGQKPISNTRSHDHRSLATYFIQSMEENHLLEILDPRILKDGRKEEMMAVARLGRRCLNPIGKKRPTMREVAIDLEGIKKSQGGCTTERNYHEEFEYSTTDLSEVCCFNIHSRELSRQSHSIIGRCPTTIS